MDVVSQKGLCKYCFDNTAVPSFYCLDCELFLCDSCLESHNSSKIGSGHKLVKLRCPGPGDSSGTEVPKRFCTQGHPKKQVIEFSCKTCNIDICHQCFLTSHGDHKVVRIGQFVDDSIWEILMKKESLLAKMSSFKHREEQLDRAMEITEQNISRERLKISTMINTTVKALQKHQQQITAEIDKKQQSYSLSAKEEKRDLKLQLARMSKVIEQAESVVESSEKGAAGVCASALLKRFDQVLELECRSNAIKTIEMKYSLDQNAFQVPRGRLNFSATNLLGSSAKKEANHANAQNCHIADNKDEPPTIKTNKESADIQLTVPSLQSGDELRRRHSNSSKTTPELVRQSLVLGGGGNSYMPVTQFTREINPPALCDFTPRGTFGETGKGKGEFRKPRGISLNSKGELAIADSMNHRVQILAATGDFIRQIGRKGSGNGELQHPVSVVFDSCDNVIVSDTNNCNVQMFNPEGKFIKKIGAKEVRSPYGVTVSSENNIIVCDVSDHTLKVFSSNGKVLLMTIGTAIETTPQCTRYGPYFAVYQDEQYIVSYCGGNHCVKIFDKKGNYVRSVSKEGKNAGELFCPRGIAVSNRDHVLVCDSGNNRVQIFTLDGRFISKLGTKGMGLGQFDRLEDIVISQGGRVYVTDMMNDRVEYFDY